MIKKGKRRGTAATSLLWLAVLVGLGMVVYPRVEDRIQEKKQLEILSEWSRQARLAQTGAASGADDQPAEKPTPSPTPVSFSEPPLPEWKTVDGTDLLGSVRIEAVGLTEPIVRGADEQSLLKGAGTVLEDILPGQPGNFVLAGHRSLTKGRHFNRLGEVKAGDEVDIDTTAGTYRYIVTGTKVVEPTDLSVLDQDASVSTLTLITCTPLRVASHRLIVTAKLETQQPARSGVSDEEIQGAQNPSSRSRT